ncbi:MAG: hypothetical protein Q8S33_09655 [Myxococcales bacterium]|nr:hypothetical protein [Myxococcales bacterium]
MVAGGAALFGVPGGLVSPMRMEVDAVEYIDESLPLRKDMAAYEKAIAGLAAVRIWVKTQDGAARDAARARPLQHGSGKRAWRQLRHRAHHVAAAAALRGRPG